MLTALSEEDLPDRKDSSPRGRDQRVSPKKGEASTLSSSKKERSKTPVPETL